MKFKCIERYEEASFYVHEGNGLRLIVWPYVLAPVVGVQVTYEVGSRHEVTGSTGVAHLLEHLMFKGSQQFDTHHEDNIHALEDRGALLNATTWSDRTNYYEVLLKEDMELALKIEADRMRGACLREEDRASEMTVVRNEYERGENDAFSVLYRHVWAMSYLAHPYHHSTIGWLPDIEGMSIEDIRSFYHRFYGPNNAVVTVVGDLDEAQVLDWVDRYFGALPALSQPIPKIYTQEEPQEGARHFVIRRGEHVRWIAVSHRAPRGLERDHIGLQVLAKLLSQGQMAYLQRALVDQGHAMAVYVDAHPFHDPGLFTTYVNLSFDADPEDVTARVLACYRDIQAGGMTEADLQRAKTQLLAEKAFERDGLMGLLQSINEGIACGDWKYGLEFSQRVSDLSIADLVDIACRYWVEDSMVTGYYLPKIKKHEEIR